MNHIILDGIWNMNRMRKGMEYLKTKKRKNKTKGRDRFGLNQIIEND
jgi:hypothetical protein